MVDIDPAAGATKELGGRHGIRSASPNRVPAAGIGAIAIAMSYIRGRRGIVARPLKLARSALGQAF